VSKMWPIKIRTNCREIRLGFFSQYRAALLYILPSIVYITCLSDIKWSTLTKECDLVSSSQQIFLSNSCLIINQHFTLVTWNTSNEKTKNS